MFDTIISYHNITTNKTTTAGVQDFHAFVLPPEGEMMATLQQPGAGDKIYTDVLAEGRTNCYKARDAFYACMEKEVRKGNKPTEIGTVGLLYPVECKKSRAEFVKQCRTSWVKHFDRQYCAKKRVQRLLDDESGTRRGPISLPQPSAFKP